MRPISISVVYIACIIMLKESFIVSFLRKDGPFDLDN